MRYTEQELRDFLTRHAQEFRDEYNDARNSAESAYALGAFESYEFVLRFMDEYKLEEVDETQAELDAFWDTPTREDNN